MKTAEGQAELVSRQRGVSQRHRTMLFLVDGRRSVTQVKSLAAQAGVPETCFDELLGLGLISLPLPGDTAPGGLPSQRGGLPSQRGGLRQAPEPSSFHLELPLADIEESVLPPSRTLQPESTLQGDPDAAESWYAALAAGDDPNNEKLLDAPMEEARDILLRAVRAEAPVAGSLTLLRLRRARTRADLLELLEEVESRIRKPHRVLATTQVIRRVRQLLNAL
jgi:hypothetical protein